MTSASCIGEKCFCGRPASAKVEETIFDDDWSMTDDGPMGGMPRGMRGRHPFTSYVCAGHFAQIMHNGEDPGPFSPSTMAIIDINVGRRGDGSFASVEEADAPIRSIVINEVGGKISVYAVANMDTPGLYSSGLEHSNFFLNENDMLKSAVDALAKYDLLAGWNIAGFDVPYLVNRLSRIAPICVQTKLGRGEMPVAYNFTNFVGRPRQQFVLKDRQIVDLMMEYKRKFTIKSYRLDFVLKHEKIAEPAPYEDNETVIQEIERTVKEVEHMELLATRHDLWKDTTFGVASLAAHYKANPLPPLPKLNRPAKRAATKLRVEVRKGRYRVQIEGTDDVYTAKSLEKAIGRLIASDPARFDIELTNITAYL